MKRAISLGVVTAVGMFMLVPATLHASTSITDNRGAIIKVSASCQQVIDQVSNNRGVIIKVTGDGTCDANQIISSGAISDNRGSIIKIDGVCGTNVPDTITNNRGSIIKVTTSGPCEVASTTTATGTTISDNRGSIVKIDTPVNDVTVENNRGSIVKVETVSTKPATTEKPKTETPKAETSKTETSVKESAKPEATPVAEEEVESPKAIELPVTGPSSIALTTAALGASTYGLSYLLRRRG